MSRYHDEVTYAALVAAMDQTPALCEGDDRFISDELTDADQTPMRELCALCPLRALCGAYATTSRVQAGFFAGVAYPARGRR